MRGETSIIADLQSRVSRNINGVAPCIGALSAVQARDKRLFARQMQGNDIFKRLKGSLFNLGSAAVLAGGLACAAEAQDLSAPSSTAANVEGIVVTAPHYVPTDEGVATKSGTPLLETPQSVTVITRDQIDLLDIQNLGQAVRYTSGVDGEIFGDDPRYDWVTVRGFYPVEYIDGLQAPVGSVSNTGIDLWGFQTAEVLKGPSSTLYGLAPPGGIINLTSRRPQDSFGGEIQVTGGSFGDKQVAGDVTGPIADGLDFRLTGLYRDTDTQTQGVYDRRYYIAPALTWNIDRDTSLTFLSNFQFDKVMGDGGGFLPAYGTLLHNPNGQLPVSANVGQLGYNDFNRQQWSLGYDFKHAFSEAVSFEQNLKYFGNENHTLQIYGAGLEPGSYTQLARYNFPFVEHIRAFEVDNRLKIIFDTGPVKNTVLLGVDYRNYTLNSAFGFAVAAPVNIYDPSATPAAGIVTPALSPYEDTRQAQTGVYVQDQARLGRFVLTIGGREDFVHTYDGAPYTAPTDVNVSNQAFTYRVGGAYVFDNGVAPYIAYATSFQPLAGSTATGAPYQPTTGDQVEGGVKFQPTFLPRQVSLLSTAAVFDLHQNNVLAPDLNAQPVLQEQIGQVHVAGLELETVARLYERLSVNFSYSYLFSRASAAERVGGPDTPTAEIGTYNPDPPLYMTPRNKASLLVDYTLPDGPLKGFGFGAGVRYTGVTYGDFAGEWANPSTVLWDGLVHYNFDKWRLQIDASNLFDKTYVAQCSSYADCYYGLRRNVQASLTRAF